MKGSMLLFSIVILTGLLLLEDFTWLAVNIFIFEIMFIAFVLLAFWLSILFGMTGTAGVLIQLLLQLLIAPILKIWKLVNIF